MTSKFKGWVSVLARACMRWFKAGVHHRITVQNRYRLNHCLKMTKIMTRLISHCLLVEFVFVVSPHLPEYGRYHTYLIYIIIPIIVEITT